MFKSLIIFGAEYLIFILVGIFIGYFLLQPTDRKRNIGLFSMLAFPLIFVVAKIASLLYDNPRPFVALHFVPLVRHAADNGFPSDHTLLSAAVAVVVFRFHRKLGSILFVLAVIVGVSRVLAGVHHAVDIAASLIIAGIVGWIVHIIIFSKSNKTNKPINQ